MQLTNQQAAAVDAVNEWLKTDYKVFILTGYAGTGKTSIAKHLAQSVNAVFAAFTGKAALVLTQKGCPASTIHSLIYRSTLDETTGEWRFTVNPDSPAATADLVVVDEVSMLSATEGSNLLNLAKKILVLGDPGQLPPIGEKPFFDLSKPHFHLDEIHRQAADNPIIKLATDVRLGRSLALGNYGESRVLKARKFVIEEMAAHEQTIVGRNVTRHSLNQRHRVAANLSTGVLPVPNDRLMCLRNNSARGHINGQMWFVTRATYDSESVELVVSENPELESEPHKLYVLNEFFVGKEAELDWQRLRLSDQFCYGYAITAHKAQGSTYKDCLIVDESAVFREDQHKWLYTALTRAAERVTVYI